MSQVEHSEVPSSKEEGEVVERNGETVVRVKKRKRRSAQKKHETDSSSKASLLKFIITIVAIVIVLAVSSSLLMMYVNGRAFESKVERAVASELGGEATVAGLSVRPTIFSAKSLTFQASDDHFLQALTLDEIRADHRGYGIVGGTWMGDEIAAKSGSLILNLNKPLLESPTNSVLSHRYGSFRCDTMNVTLKGGRVDRFIKGTEIVRRKGKVSVRGGELNISWPKNLSIKSVKFESGNIPRVIGTIIYQEQKEISFSGSFSEGDFDLESEIKNLHLTTLAPKISRLVRGDLSFKAAKIQGKLDELILSGKFKADRLSIYTSGIQQLFDRLEISKESYLYSEVEAEGIAEISEKDLKLKDFKIVKKDEFELRGNFEASGNRLSARLALIVPEEKKEVILNDSLLSRLCVRLEEGTYRVTIRIGGTLKNPTDDLSARIQGDKFGEMDSSAKELLEKQLDQLLSK